MRILAVIGNFVLTLFTCAVIYSDGMPKKPVYVLYSIFAVLIPVFTAGVMLRGRQEPLEHPSLRAEPVRAVAFFPNLLLLAFTLWASIHQHPHPAEAGLVPFALLMFLAPVLNVVVLSGGMPSANRPATRP